MSVQIAIGGSKMVASTTKCAACISLGIEHMTQQNCAYYLHLGWGIVKLVI